MGDFLFIYTNHALHKMDARGITREEVEKIIRMGMKWKEPTTEKWHALASGVEVVFMKDKSTFYIITAYLAVRS